LVALQLSSGGRRIVVRAGKVNLYQQ